MDSIKAGTTLIGLGLLLTVFFDFLDDLSSLYKALSAAIAISGAILIVYRRIKAGEAQKLIPSLIGMMVIIAMLVVYFICQK